MIGRRQGLTTEMREDGVLDPGAFRWVGPGGTGLLWPVDRAGSGGGRESRSDRSATTRVTSVAEAQRLWPADREEDREALSAYFTAGGVACRVLRTGAEPRGWIGVDGGPGERTGVNALLDEEEVGTIVWPPVPPGVKAEVVQVARQSPGVFFIAEEREPERLAVSAEPGSASPSPSWPTLASAPLENLVFVQPAGSAGRASGILAGRLDALDFATPAGVRRAAGDEWLERIQRWRLRAAVRRSLDLGSRWILFEPDHPLIWRRLEREARAFIHELMLEGILAPWEEGEFEVRCEPARGKERKEGCVEIRIRVKLADQHVSPRRSRVF